MSTVLPVPATSGGEDVEEDGKGMPQNVIYGCFGGSLALIVAGVIVITVLGGAGDLDSVDPATAFASLGTSCNITQVHHVAASRREESGDGSGSQTFDLCRDTVSYSFSKGGSGSYTSRESVTQRNVEAVTLSGPVLPGGQAASADMCTPGGDNQPYRGQVYVPVDGPPEECPNGPSSCTSDTPYVCVGECSLGQSVACWEPSVAGFNADWANCGNPECIKLVDPELEYKIALDDAELLTVYGIALIAIGVPVGLIAFCCYCSPEAKAARARKAPVRSEPQVVV
jgi:hypothetical protein